MSPLELRLATGRPLLATVLSLGTLAVIALSAGDVAALFSFGVPGAAAFGVARARAARCRITIDDAGVTEADWRGTVAIAWRDIDHYTFHVTHAGRSVGPRRPHRHFAVGRLGLVATDKRSIALDDRWVGVVNVLDAVFEQLHEHLKARGTPSYHPFDLAELELRHSSKGTLALVDVEEVTASGSWLTVKQRGKHLAWARIEMVHLANSILFLEELVRRGVTVKTADELFIPQLALSTIAQPIPRARIVER